MTDAPCLSGLSGTLPDAACAHDDDGQTCRQSTSFAKFRVCGAGLR
ncbi:hypothetical protein [Paraburkholderia sp.]|nr:hypothetical protein [Paraburkholderia sp.]MDE1182782.1 hypothetical protein [Paraburkholderia sp.]